MLSKQDWKDRVSSCKKCTKNTLTCNDIVNKPRYGFGSRTPKLMVIGQSPTIVASRRMNGAFMLHYNGPRWDHLKGPEEKAMSLLLSTLSVSTKDVYGTNVVKCAVFNEQYVTRYLSDSCRREHLLLEISERNPGVILAVGGVARCAMIDWMGCFPTAHRDFSHRPVDPFSSYKVQRWGNVISIPHPRTIGINYNTKTWLTNIRAAYMEIA